LRVLIVEDNVDSGEMLAELLQVTGAEVHHVVDGDTALTTGGRLRPQVILLDIGLPGKTGYEVAREVRATTWGEQAFIVALTGWGSAEDRVRTREAGFDRHLVKPVQPDALLKLIAERQARRMTTEAAEQEGTAEPSRTPEAEKTAAKRASRALGSSPVE
jgi:DNA-binding response OmpR family regulator